MLAHQFDVFNLPHPWGYRRTNCWAYMVMRKKTKTVHVCSMRLKLSNDPNSSLENSEQMINASCVDKAYKMPYSGVVAIVLSCRPEEEKFYFRLKRESAALLEEKNSETHSVMSNSLGPHGLYSPWVSPDQNTGVGSCSLLQGIFATQGSNPGLAHGRQILYQLSHQESWSRVISF